MSQKTIVFDFGGVIFRTSVSAFYRARFEQQGRSEEELQYFLAEVLPKNELSRSNSGNLQDLLDKKALQHPQWADEIYAYGAGAGFIKTVQGTIPGMAEVLAELKAEGHRIVGLTNWHGDTYETLPKAFPGLLAHFNKVVVSGKTGLRKPDPEIFRYAHKAYGSPDASDVYYFDDKAANVETAQATVGWSGFVFENADTVRRALAMKPKAP